MSGSQRTHNFADRHIGPDASDATEMLRVIGRDSLSALIHDTVAAIDSCPPGHVEVIANYTAFLQLQRALERSQ